MPETAEQLRERKRLEKQRQRAALRADPEKYLQALEARNRADRERRARRREEPMSSAKPEPKKPEPKKPEPKKEPEPESDDDDIMDEYELMTKYKNFGNIRTVYKAYSGDKKPKDIDVVESLEWLTDYILLSETIHNMDQADSSKKKYFASINAFLKEFHPDQSAINHYQREMKELEKKITSKKGNNEPNKKEEERHVFWDDVIGKLDDINDSEDAVVYGFYTDRAPRRLKDLFLLKVWTKSADGLKRASTNYNYVRIEDGEVAEIVLKNYKTYNKYGEYIMKPSDDYKEKIMEYIEERELKHGDLLFKRYQESSKQTQVVKSVFDRVVGKPMTVGDLRKSMASYYWDDMNLNEKKSLALLMGTSVSMLELEYLKLPFKKKNKK
jgi:hypothetical protein